MGGKGDYLLLESRFLLLFWMPKHFLNCFKMRKDWFTIAFPFTLFTIVCKDGQSKAGSECGLHVANSI